MKEELLCPAPQGRGFDIKAMTGRQKAHISLVRALALNTCSIIYSEQALLWTRNAGRGRQNTGMSHACHMSHMHVTWLQGLPSAEYSASKAYRDTMVVPPMR